MQVLLTNSFKKQYKKIPQKIQKTFLEKLEIFTDNPILLQTQKKLVKYKKSKN